MKQPASAHPIRSARARRSVTRLGRPSTLALPALGLLALVLTSCSSSSAPATTTTSPTTTSASTTTHPVTTTTSPSPTTTSTVSPKSCPAANLQGTNAGGMGAAGTIQTSITLRNVTSTTCVLGGYPGLLLIGSDGKPLPTVTIRKGTYPFTAQAPTLVTLGPGQVAHINIGYSDVPVGTESSCPMATALQVIPPNATDHLTVTMSLSPCDQGKLVTSPVLSGPGGS